MLMTMMATITIMMMMIEVIMMMNVIMMRPQPQLDLKGNETYDEEAWVD